jgi:hypothetical protein
MKEKILKSSASSTTISLPANAYSTMSISRLNEKSTRQIKKETSGQNFLEYPSWMNERAYLSWDFYQNPNSDKFDSVCNSS